MAQYFFIHDDEQWERVIAPAFGASARSRTFAPLGELVQALGRLIRANCKQSCIQDDELLIWRMNFSMSFDRRIWTTLVGELLLLTAAECPQIQTVPETLCLLIEGKSYQFHSRFGPIHQAHFGSRDLCFGGQWYRPDSAGCNNREDVGRIAGQLAAVNPASWDADALRVLQHLENDEDREDELAFAREWFPPLSELYVRATDHNQIVICEQH